MPGMGAAGTTGGAMGWSHYDAVAENIVFAHFMLAWCLIALDLFQNLKRYKRRKEERKQWKKS